MGLPRQGMTLITEFQGLIKRDFATGLDLSPTAAIPLLDGEFMGTRATAGFEAEVVRVGNANAAAAVVDTQCAPYPSWAVTTERGRYDTQAIGKVTVLFAGGYEADFRVWDLDDNAAFTVGTAIHAGNANPNLGDGNTPARGMLTTNGAVASDLIVGWCTRPASDAGNAGSIVRVYIPGSFAIREAA